MVHFLATTHVILAAEDKTTDEMAYSEELFSYRKNNYKLSPSTHQSYTYCLERTESLQLTLQMSIEVWIAKIATNNIPIWSPE